MSSSIDLYRKEIFNFLRTVTIKFEPFAYAMGRTYMDTYGISDPHGKWNPYYIHLAGEYTAEELAAGKVMHVYTVERELLERVVFTKDLINTNPKTASLYRLPNDEYIHLEESYPEYRGLIRCMVYPISSIEDAINAPNLSLLAYDDSLLEVNERESIINCLKNFLDMVRTRWWLVEFTYEDMYASTFWAMLWQMLPEVLLGQRFRNIGTPYVHSFHVWEYLKSKGLGDYRDVLTMRQSLWLYRNINYILKNKGKVSNLSILAENLLEDACVSLRKVNMLQSTDEFTQKLHTVPQFIFYNYFTDIEENVAQYDDLNPRLCESGLNNQDSVEYVNATSTALGTIRYNDLPTKYLELKKESIDTSSEAMMTTFLLHTLVYRSSLGKLAYSVGIVDMYTGNNVKLFINDMILLLFYSACKSVGISPTRIPNQARVRVPFLSVKPTKLTEYIKYADTTYAISELVDVEGVLNLFEWPTRAFVSRDDFAEFANHQYALYYLFYKQMESSNKYLYHKAFRRMLDDLTANKMVDLELSQYEYFEDWIGATPEINSLIEQYESISDPAVQCNTYKNLSMLCYNTIFDMENSSTGINTIRKMDSIYDAVRDLFISLCSYNVTFIDAARELRNYLNIEEPDFLIGLHTDEDNYLEGSYFNLLLDDIEYLTRDKWKCELTTRLHDIEYSLNVSYESTLINMFIQIYFDISCSILYSIEEQRTTTIGVDIDQQDTEIVYNFNLHTGIDTTSVNLLED